MYNILYTCLIIAGAVMIYNTFLSFSSDSAPSCVIT